MKPSASSQSLAETPAITRLWGMVRVDVPEIWLRFLVAVIGLGIAFAAALFSTVTRESGNLWATLILASVALFMAATVGLTTVPYLARRVAGARLRDAFDYEVTKIGAVYAAVVLLIGIAAMNTGNNLLYIVVAAMLAAIVVSGFASAMVLNTLELDVQLPDHVFAGRAMVGRIEVKNRRRWLPSFSVNVVSAKDKKLRKRWEWIPTTFTFPRGRPADEQWLQLPDRRLRQIAERAALPRIFEGAAYFPYIAPAGTVAADLEITFPRRGRYEQESFGLATRFPFSFLSKTRWVPLKRELLVFPPVEPSPQFFEVLPLIAGQVESYRRGRGHDLYSIREYMPEDSARHVDWKATAKSGSLKVREFSRDDERKVRIVFDNPAPGTISTEAYEVAVALAASLAWHFSAENTAVSCLAPGYEDDSDIYDFLAYLAVVEPRAGASVLDELQESNHLSIVFTSQNRSLIPSRLLAKSHFIFMTQGPRS